MFLIGKRQKFGGCSKFKEKRCVRLKFFVKFCQKICRDRKYWQKVSKLGAAWSKIGWKKIAKQEKNCKKGRWVPKVVEFFAKVQI